MDEFKYRNKVIESNIETKDKNVGSKKSYTYIVIHGNKKRNDVRTESNHNHMIQNDDVGPN